jgi:hypothetical protein
MDGMPAHGSEPEPFAGVEFAPRAPSPAPSRAQRGAVAIVVVALHALFAWFVEIESQRRDDGIDAVDEPVAIAFIEILPRQVIRAGPAPEPAPMRIVPALPRAAPTHAPSPRVAPRTAASPLRLYDADGALVLPDGLMDELDRKADRPQFDFQQPGLAEAGRFLERPTILAYESTRFDAAWKPSENLLDEVLRRAAEKTSPEVRIPIPGAPGKKIVCRVVILAAGGSCWVERDEEWKSPGRDDPATLSPAEAAACDAWWARIVGARSQAEWRATRKLYEAECRKPLEAAPRPKAEETATK